MTNAEKFWNLFDGLTATELWAMPEDEFLMWLNSEATVDVAPVVHGRWIRVVDNNGQHQVCEFCGEWKYHINQKFCGECGARMDGKDEDG